MSGFRNRASSSSGHEKVLALTACMGCQDGCQVTLSSLEPHLAESEWKSVPLNPLGLHLLPTCHLALPPLVFSVAESQSSTPCFAVPPSPEQGLGGRASDTNR